MLLAKGSQLAGYPSQINDFFQVPKILETKKKKNLRRTEVRVKQICQKHHADEEVA
jgi:hypothetical protein